MSGSTRQRRDIQGLRAVAVLAVIAAHVFQVPAGGFVGVDVFFVISGFLITGLLLRESGRTGTISFRRFYERRAKRILPAAVVVLVATTIASVALLGKKGGIGVGIDALYSAFFLGNWRFAAEGVDYFAQGTPPSPLQHFWSLGVEEQFYLVWPWVMLAIIVFAASRGWSALRARRLTRTLIVLLTAASFGWALYETQANHAFAYFSTFSRAWELGIGAVLAFLPALPLGLWWRRAMAWVGIAGIAASLVVVTESSPLWPAPLGLLPVISTALVIAAGTDPWILSNRVATYIGDISYSLYLWHFPIAILGVTILPAGSLVYYAAALVAMFAASILSYHLIENPARRATWFARPEGRIRGLTRAWIPVTSALAVVVLVGTAGIAAVSVVRGDEQATGPVAEVVAPTPGATEDQIDPATDCWGAGTSLHPDECAEADLTPIVPSSEDLLDDTGGAYQCYNASDTELNSCTFGVESDDATRVAIVGDSHAAGMLPALWQQLEGLGWSLDTFVGRGCALTLVTDVVTDCDVARPAINEALTSGDYDVVLATSTRKFGKDQASQEAIMAQIRDAGSQLIVVEDNPLPTEESIACTTRLGASADSECGTAADVALADTHTLAAAARSLDLPVVDLTQLYCDDDFCPGIIGGVRVYRDAAGHVTATWATSMSAPLARALIDAL